MSKLADWVLKFYILTDAWSRVAIGVQALVDP